MNKRKISFNFIDLIILAVLAAAVGVLLYVFLYGLPKKAQQSKTTAIVYTVEITNIDKNTAKSIDLLLNDKSRTYNAWNGIDQKICMGKVLYSQYGDYSVLAYDYDEGTEVAAPVAGKAFLDVTIRAEATDTDRAYSVDGCEIRVGEQYSLILPNFYGAGYCISLKPADGDEAAEAPSGENPDGEAETAQEAGKNPGMIPAWLPFAQMKRG